MFTGIITHLGKLEKKEGNTFTFSVPSSLYKRLENGASIAVNGACLTVTGKRHSAFSVDLMPETVKKTVFQKIQMGDLVNLELPATPDTALSGHIVQGHVDELGVIQTIKKQGNSHLFTIKVKPNLTKYMVEKGSIAINGISLTIICVTRNSFKVGIIPYTWNYTMLRSAKVGDSVHIEVDVLAKYVEKLLKNRI